MTNCIDCGKKLSKNKYIRCKKCQANTTIGKYTRSLGSQKRIKNQIISINGYILTYTPHPTLMLILMEELDNIVLLWKLI